MWSSSSIIWFHVSIYLSSFIAYRLDIRPRKRRLLAWGHHLEGTYLQIPKPHPWLKVPCICYKMYQHVMPSLVYFCWDPSIPIQLLIYMISYNMLCYWGAPIIAHSTGHYVAGSNSQPPLEDTLKDSESRGKGLGKPMDSLKRSYSQVAHHDPQSTTFSPKKTLRWSPTFVESSVPGEVFQDAQSRHDCSLPSDSPKEVGSVPGHAPSGRGVSRCVSQASLGSGESPTTPAPEKEEKDALFWKSPSCFQSYIHFWRWCNVPI